MASKPFKLTVVAESKRIPTTSLWDHTEVSAAQLLGAEIEYLSFGGSWHRCPLKQFDKAFLQLRAVFRE